MARVADYYRLTKPGIVYGNLLHVVGGVLLAAPVAGSWSAALSVAVATSLLIASACTINNLIDRPFDAQMARTKNRPSVTGVVSQRHAIAFAVVLATSGLALLIVGTNTLTALIGVTAYVWYAFIYTYSKRLTVHSTLIGTVPGALPAMAGYTALIGSIDSAAWLLFSLIVVWQLPHFYAISAFRRDDYAAAKWPVLSTQIGESSMRHVIISLVALYWLTALIFSIMLLNVVAGAVLMGGASYWLYRSLQSSSGHVKWARSVFGVSMIMWLVFGVAMLVDFALKLQIQ